MSQALLQRVENLLADWCVSRKLSAEEAKEALVSVRNWIDEQLRDYEETCMGCRSRPAQEDGYCDKCFPADGSSNQGV